MNACINTDSAEYRALKERSGLSDFQLKVAVRAYLNEHENSWPNLDEIPGADSSESLKKSLKLTKNGGTKIENILEATGTLSLEEATLYINNTYRDLYTEILPLNKEAVVTIEKRPDPFKINTAIERDLSTVNSRTFINQALLRLAQGYGILTISMTTQELEKQGILSQVPEGAMAAAFILDGNIIINSDVASVDAPVHELMHVLMGSLKYTYPDLYYNIVQLARQLPSYDYRASLYKNRAQSDIDEEVFVQEYAKFLSGVSNEFVNLDPEITYKINYEVSRTLDTILNGDNSVRMVPEAFRFGTTLRNLGIIVNSKNMESRYQGFADSAFLDRVLGNIKSDLFKSNKLEEICQ